MAIATIIITDVPEEGGVTLQLASDPDVDPTGQTTLTLAQAIALDTIKKLASTMTEITRDSFSNLPN